MTCIFRSEFVLVPCFYWNADCKSTMRRPRVVRRIREVVFGNPYLRAAPAFYRIIPADRVRAYGVSGWLRASRVGLGPAPGRQTRTFPKTKTRARLESGVRPRPGDSFARYWVLLGQETRLSPFAICSDARASIRSPSPIMSNFAGGGLSSRSPRQVWATTENPLFGDMGYYIVSNGARPVLPHQILQPRSFSNVSILPLCCALCTLPEHTFRSSLSFIHPRVQRQFISRLSLLDTWGQFSRSRP